LLATVGNKRVLAFFIPGNDQCVQAVIWNADDMEATTAGRVRVSLNPGQNASIDGSASETFTILCRDRAETLLSVDPNPGSQVVSK